MKIQAGARNWSDFFYYLENGAHEIYCALNSIPGHCYRGKDFEKVEDILKAAELAHNKGVKLYMVANEVRGDLFPESVSAAEKAVAGGVDGVIIRDLTLLEELGKRRVRTEFILTSLALCFNADTLAFYSDLGITRIALPEQILPREAEKIVNNGMGIGTEVFLGAREYCVVFNGFCYLTDFTGECICRKPFASGNKKVFLPRPSSKEHFSRLYDFHSMGVDILKIGRHPDGYYGRVLFREAAALLKILESGAGKDKFLEKSAEIDLKIGRILENKKKGKGHGKSHCA